MTARRTTWQTVGVLGAMLMLSLAGTPATAASGAVDPALCAGAPARSAGTFTLRVDNDLFGGLGQDQGYTNGLSLSWASPNLANYRNDPCLPEALHTLNRALEWLQPGGADAQNMTVGLSQLMFTPTNRTRRDLIHDDRPYAGALLLGVGYNVRQGPDMRSSQLRIGVVGPAARAGVTQTWWHGVIGVDRFRGWDNQLHNEPVVQLLHDERRRLVRRESTGGWGWDLTRHWGVSAGNFATFGEVGLEWRFGSRVPDDFGTAPLRSAAENTAPLRATPRSGWHGHVFVAVDARWVLRDITLDGNTFRDSHSVHKRPLVADVGYGLAFTDGTWRIVIARRHRTQEFLGQKENPVYGTITIGRRF